jgi:guanine deaminase
LKTINLQALSNEVIDLACASVSQGGGPFAAIILDPDGNVLAAANNVVTLSHDPTAHAEVSAIRKACAVIQSHSLEGCTIISSCEPCPMCLGAIYWAGIEKVYYLASRHDAADAGFSDEHIYTEINKKMEERNIPFLHYDHPLSAKPFRDWLAMADKILY